MENGKNRAIRQEMAKIRQELNEDVEDVVEHAKELTDWRNFVRSNPWLCVAAAASIGYLIVPRRLNVISPGPETLAKLAKQNRLIVKPKPEVEKRGGILGPVVNFVAGLVLRSAMTSAGHHASKFFSDEMKPGAPAGSPTYPLGDHDA